MTSLDIVRRLMELTKNKCLEWVEEKSGETYFVDPLDHEEISAHYGATHAAASFLIIGKLNSDSNIEGVGKRLLISILDRWETSSKLPSFHYDFNNFALCVAYDYLEGELRERVKCTVLSTPDSRHDTVNWIPMRWFVNKCRYEWTKNEKYQSACTICTEKIKSATYEDGFIDDRLPKGMSFNLQYDVATVAVLQYLRNHGEELDISKETGSLLNAVAPDGDINYFGRGTNQIFAWGLWLYLLVSAGLENDLQKALGYCADKIPVMLENNNLMLNDWEGAEKYLWWDYHYCSVYTAHLLLWLALAIKDAGKGIIVPTLSEARDSGIEILHKGGWFVATFAGRTEYLAERGPVIAAIGREDGKMFVKGTFGPWQGAFGRKYAFHESVINNFCGLLKMRTERDWSDNRVLRKILLRKPNTARILLQPVFAPLNIDIDEQEVLFTWDYSQNEKLCFNFPTMNECSTYIKVKNKVMPMINTGCIKNQYGLFKLFQRHVDCTGGVTFSIIRP